MRSSVFAWLVLGGALATSACADEPAAPAPAASPTALPATPPPALAAQPPAPVSATPAPVRVYVLGLLRKGPSWSAEDTPERQALQARHIANLERLGREGKLVAAGPSGPDGDLRGILVLAVESVDEARALAESDPAVQAGRLRVEYQRFLGSPGIGRNVEAERAKAGKVEMVEYQLALVRLGRHFNASEANENRAVFMARNAWLQQVESSGRLSLSGPVLDGTGLAGLLVLRAGSLEAARATLNEDPAVKTERFAFDLHPLWLAKGTLD